MWQQQVSPYGKRNRVKPHQQRSKDKCSGKPTQEGLVCNPSTSVQCRQVALKMNSNARACRGGRNAQRQCHQPSHPIIAELPKRSFSTYTGLLQMGQPPRSQDCLLHNVSGSLLWCGNDLCRCHILLYVHRSINVFSNFQPRTQTCSRQPKEGQRSVWELRSCLPLSPGETPLPETHPGCSTWNSTSTPKAYWDRLRSSQNPGRAENRKQHKLSSRIVSLSGTIWLETGRCSCWLKNMLNWAITRLLA